MLVVWRHTTHFICVNAFISKLYRERSLGNSLPISEHVDRQEQLRRERQAEYKEFLSTKRQQTNVGRDRASVVAKARRKLAEERDAELSAISKERRDANEKRSHEQILQEHAPLVDGAHRAHPSHREETYEEMRARKARDERRYRSSMMDYQSPQDIKGGGRVVRFEDECSPPPPVMERRGNRRTWTDSGVHLPATDWEDDDERYLQWAKNRGRYSAGVRGNQSSTSLHQETKPTAEIEEGSRTRSAPSKQGSGGVLNLGLVQTDEERKTKQRMYAEELRQQMKQKNEERAREKVHQRRSTSEIVIKSPDKVDLALVEKRAEKMQLSPGRPSSQPKFRLSPTGPHTDKWYNTETPHYTEGHSAHHWQPRRSNFYPPPPHSSAIPPMPYYPYPYPPPVPQYPPQEYYYPPAPPFPPPHHYSYSHSHEGYTSGRKGTPRSPFDEGGIRLPSRECQRENVSQRNTLGVGNGPSLEDSPQASLPLTVSPKVNTDKDAYRSELEKQIREKKERDHKETMKDVELEKKKDAEIAEYNPWGKGGSGAPIRRPDGRIVADLRKMRQDNDAKINNRSPGAQLGNQIEDLPPSDREQLSYRDASYQGRHTPYSSRSPCPTEVIQPDLTPQEMYRMELQRQIEEKEELKRRETEKKRVEEEKEAKRLEAERQKLKEDYERELEKQKQKKEEVKAKNEAMRQAVEEKKKVAEQKAKELEQREKEELARKVREEEVELHRRRARAQSPPVPTVRNQLKQQGYSYRPPLLDSTSAVEPASPHKQQQADRRDSPPVPALRHKADTKTTTFTDMPQYTAEHTVTTMKAQLQLAQQEPPPPPSESRMPPENDDVLQANKPTQLSECFDGQSEPKSAHGDSSSEVILEKLMAMRRLLTKEQTPRAVAAPRKKSGKGPFDLVRVDPRKLNSGSTSSLVQQEKYHPVSSQAADYPDQIAEFNRLKYGGEADQRGRGELLNLFPEPPRSSSALEIQQAQLLRHQQDSLARLQQAVKHHGATTEINKENHPRALERMLPSTTFDVGVDTTVRPQSSRRTRRKRYNISANFNSGGNSEVKGVHRPTSQSSFSSFDVDSVAERNQQRLHKLESVLQASKDATDKSPDEVVEEFLEKRAPYVPQLNRHEVLSRMSERSLQAVTTHHPVYSASARD